MFEQKQRKQTYQLHFKNGEVIKLDGYASDSNRVNRAFSVITILLVAPLRVARNNIIYFTLIIFSLILLSSIWNISPLNEFYFTFTLQLIAHITIELYNKLKIMILDRKINQQEIKILKQWDECISNKQILDRIKEKVTKTQDNKLAQQSQHQQDYLMRQYSQQKSKSSGVLSQLSRQSINNHRPSASPNPHLDRMQSRLSVMSPLIHQDMILKNELRSKLIQDPSIKKFMSKVPCMFNFQRNKKIIDKKITQMDLIKMIKSSEVQLGDVIIVERNQIAQCDILVLYCNDEYFTVQNQLCEYSQTTIRQPLMQNRYDSHNLVLFKKSFTGTIVLNESSKTFNGYFQLKKDPQSRVIGEQNMLYAQEKLLNTPWVIGVVIKVGLKCNCYKGFKIKQQLPNYSQRVILSIFCIDFAYLILMYIVASQNKQIIKYFDIIQIIVENLLHLLFLLPHSFRFFYSLLQLFQWKLLYSIGKLEMKQIRACQIDQYDELRRITLNLDCLLEGTFELKTIICKNKICYCKENELLLQAHQFTTQHSSQNIFKTVDSKEESKFLDFHRNEELQSADEESVANIPQSIGFRMISNFTNNDNSQINFIDQKSDQRLFKANSENQQKSLNDISQQQKSVTRLNKTYKQMTIKDSRLERKTIYTHELLKLIQSDEQFNPILLQLCLNHISFSKLRHTQTGEEKVKNSHHNLLDEKQLQISQSFGYEFICVNQVQNQLTYIIQYNFKIYSFKLTDYQIHTHSQRLYMLFELDQSLQNKENCEFILFVREANNKRTEIFDDTKINQKSSTHFDSEIESLHQIHYYYCLLNNEDAAYYLTQQAQHQNNIQSEEFIYNQLEPFLSINLILGFKYNLKQYAQEFIKNIKKTNKQLILYTEQGFSFAFSVISQTDLQNHVKLVFEQDNDDDLRAEFKKSLQQVSQLFTDTNSYSQSQVHSINKLINPSSQLSQRRLTDDGPILIILNKQSCKIIENHSYMMNHLKLLFSFAKAILLIDADQQSLGILQSFFNQPQLSLNLLFENQKRLHNYQGQYLQIALLQNFSYFQKQKYENINKQTFFKNMIQSLKVRLIYERCLFNELQIYHNSDAVLPGLSELNNLLFNYAPLLTMLSSLYFKLAFQRTLYISSFAMAAYISNFWYVYQQIDFFLEFLFYGYIYSLIYFMGITLQYIQIHKETQMEYQLFFTKKVYIGIAIKAIVQGAATKLVFTNVDILYCFLAVTICDLMCLIQSMKLKLMILLASIYFLLYFFYLLCYFALIVPDQPFIFQAINLFQVILVAFLQWISEQFFQNYYIMQFPSDKEFLHQMTKFDHHKSQSFNLQKEVDRVFENIEHVDFHIQKLLLNQKATSKSLGQWQSQIFQKAQSIMKWKKKSTIQGLQIIFLHCQLFIIIYTYSLNYYFLIAYLIYLVFEVVIFLFQMFYQLNSRQLQYVELVKFMISGAATFMIVLGLSINEMQPHYEQFTEVVVIFQISSKLHPIYDNRLYLTPITVVLITYFTIFAIYVDVPLQFIILKIVMILLFSIQQYMIKSYFILLEEDQATNQINFIEENNKINDILGILLPKFVRHRLNETDQADQYNIHQNQGHVAIVFCDICNFDQIIVEEQENIIPFLDDLFRTFDKYCEICGVQKIETVGKTYMAAAGLKACEQELAYLSEIEPVQRALNLAEMMITYIRSKLWGLEGKTLVGKIGIHYGIAISGVIGYHKPQFSLIGDTVNTTSRVCSTGLEDKITLSEVAFEQIKTDKLEFEIRYVEMKGLGQKPTYVYVQKLNTKGFIAKGSVNNSNGNSRQNTLNQNRVTSKQISKGGLTKRLTAIQQLSQRSKQLLQYQISLVANNQTSQPLSDEQQSLRKRQISISNNSNIIQAESECGDLASYKKNPFSKEQGLLQQLASTFQHKFQLEEYQPEVDHYIDYDQLLNVILLKNENQFEDNLILENSFISLLSKSFQKTHLDYVEYKLNQSERVTKKILQVYSIYYLIKQFCLIGEYDNISISFVIFQWIGCTLNFISLMIYKKKLIQHWILLICVQLSLQSITGGMFMLYDLNQFLSYFHILELIFIQSFFSNIQILQFWMKILFCLCSFLFEIIILVFLDEYRISIFFVSIGAIYNINYCYFLEEQQVACFNQKNIFQNQQAKETQLLQYLLPKHILQTFFDDNNRTKSLSDKIENVTILFADIAGFTEYSSKVTPEQVLLMLKNLFVEFDRKCFDLKVYKLYTIGDCYVAFGMIDYNDRNPAEEAKNIVELAFEMINIIEIVRKQINFNGLDMRIGIHTGCVFGGVMGTDIVRYDIYGPDVLIANKMESNGKKGQVHVSQDTKELLEQDYEDLYDFTFNTKVTLSAINRSVEGYIVEKLIEDEFPSDQIMSQQIQVQSLHSEH